MTDWIGVDVNSVLDWAAFAARTATLPNGCRIALDSRTGMPLLPKTYGYCQVKVAGVAYYAHRVAYELAVGPIPAGLDIDHLCRNPGCCEPEHLEAVTHQVNVYRIPGSNATKTHCLRGHPLSGSNLISHKGRTHRECRTCRRIREGAKVA